MTWKGKSSSKALGVKKSVTHSYFNPYIKRKATYSRNRLLLGYQEYKQMGRVYKKEFWIDIAESFIALILGARGSGKTYLQRRFQDTAIQSGFACVMPCDIKNEYISSVDPAPESQIPLLGPREEPKGVPMKAYYPYYLGDKPDNNEYFQISFGDLNYSDLITIFGLDERGRASPAQTNALMYLYSLMQDGQIATMEEFISTLDEAEDIQPVTRRSIKMRANLIDRNKILGNEYQLDVAEVINAGNHLVLDLVEYEDMGIALASAHVAILLRKIMAARRQRKINKPMFVQVDEAHEFCHRKKELTSREEIVGMANKSRSWGISMIIATQNMEDIDERIVNQSRYRFLPQNIDFEILKQVFKKSSMLEWDRDSYNEVISMHKSLRRKPNGEREWLMIDTVTKESIAFFPYSPMSSHTTESRW